MWRWTAQGNVYVADTDNNEIRKITPAGVVSTLAGSGQFGSSDGSGSAASFAQPLGVAVDSAGNVYVADFAYGDNGNVRKITPAGVVTTLIGPGLNFPAGVAVDNAGNIYVAEWGNEDICKITPAGVVTTLAGSGGRRPHWHFSPAGIAVDSAGNVYVADTNNNEIRKITPTGVVSTLAGSGLWGSSDGIGSAASFADPYGVAVDSAGNVYVADTNNNEIRKIMPAAATNQVTIRSSLPSRPMSIGGGASDVQGINLTDAELAQIQTTATGTVTIGDSTQTGNITFKTATVATTPGASTLVVQSAGGPGQIILNDNGGSGTALDGRVGTVSLTPGTGGVQVVQGSASDASLVSNGFRAPAVPLSLSLGFAPRWARKSCWSTIRPCPRPAIPSMGFSATWPPARRSRPPTTALRITSPRIIPAPSATTWC